MHAIHDEITQFIGISTRLNMLHHIDEKFIANLEIVKVVASHALLDCCYLDEAHADHEDLALAHGLEGVVEL